MAKFRRGTWYRVVFYNPGIRLRREVEGVYERTTTNGGSLVFRLPSGRRKYINAKADITEVEKRVVDG